MSTPFGPLRKTDRFDGVDAWIEAEAKLAEWHDASRGRGLVVCDEPNCSQRLHRIELHRAGLFIVVVRKRFPEAVDVALRAWAAAEAVLMEPDQGTPER